MKQLPIILIFLLFMVVFTVTAGCSMNAPAPVPPTTQVTTQIPETTGTINGNPTVNINLIAKNTAFDQSTISVPAGSRVVMTFDNQDSGMIHNFALYTDSSATKRIFVGEFITGPQKTTYTFDAPSAPGTYFYRCDVHPTVMVGTFIVT